MLDPAVPDRRVGAAAPGPRRVAIISGPTCWVVVGGEEEWERGEWRGSAFAHRGLGLDSVRPAVRPGQAPHGSYGWIPPA
jgi:hypothetical protein